jgi:glycosyltransferase involved in cell wall biosynthesis
VRGPVGSDVEAFPWRYQARAVVIGTNGSRLTMGEVDTQKEPSVPDPEISVIVPAYNAEPWIAETLRSVLDQTIDPVSYEIIVIDNGSEDQTLEVAAEALRMAPARVTLSSEAKRGPALARNHGLSLARGSWIQFLDADDLLHREKLAHQLRFAQKCNPNVGLIYSPWQSLERLSEAGWFKGPPHVPELDDGSLSSRLGSLLDPAGFFQIGSSLFRLHALRSVGGFSNVDLIEDVDLYLRLAMADWSFAHCISPEPLFCYRRHRSGSLSTGSALAFADGVVRNAALVESWARARQSTDGLLASQLVACYFQAARMFAGRDWERFDAVVERIRKLTGKVVPPGPLALTVLSKLSGYKTAERIALSWRHFKKLM